VILSRRNFLGLSLAATGGIFVPKFGAWFRQGSGLYTPEIYTYVATGSWLAPIRYPIGSIHSGRLVVNEIGQITASFVGRVGSCGSPSTLPGLFVPNLL
jgi:hypothetical protein